MWTFFKQCQRSSPSWKSSLALTAFKTYKIHASCATVSPISWGNLVGKYSEDAELDMFRERKAYRWHMIASLQHLPRAPTSSRPAGGLEQLSHPSPSWPPELVSPTAISESGLKKESRISGGLVEFTSGTRGTKIKWLALATHKILPEAKPRSCSFHPPCNANPSSRHWPPHGLPRTVEGQQAQTRRWSRAYGPHQWEWNPQSKRKNEEWELLKIFPMR